MPGLEEGLRVASQETDNRAPIEAQETSLDLSKESEPELDNSVRFEDLSKEDQERLLPQALEQMSRVLHGTKDYAVFASTAMYLNGEILEAAGDQAGKELKSPPGDFDAAVFSEQSLKEIQARMLEYPKADGTFEFYKVENGEIVYDEKHDPVLSESPSDFVSIRGEDVKKLAGKFVFEADLPVVDAQGQTTTEKKPIKYDFEFFYKSHIVPPDLAAGKTIEARGLQILNLEGLEDQYKKNLSFEGGIEQVVGEKMGELESLKSSNFRTELMEWQGDRSLSPETNHVLAELGLGAEDMKRTFEIQTRIDKINTDQQRAKRRVQDLQKLLITYREVGVPEKMTQTQGEMRQLDERIKSEEAEKQKLISERATLLTGTKTKLWKRELNVLQLARIRSGERPMEFKKVMPENVSLGEDRPEVVPANTDQEFLRKAA